MWRVEHGPEVYALRVFRPGEDEVCRREVVAMAAARAGGVPVPRVLATSQAGSRSALLLSWCPGRTVKDELVARPWRAWPLGVIFGRTHAAIHAVESPAELPPLQGRAVDAEQRSALLHLDYHPLNVMTDGGEVSGVLDWTNARAGDPRADLARTATILRLDGGQIGKPWLSSLPVRGVLRLFAAGWRHGYGGMKGDMGPFYAWAGAFMEDDLAHRYTSRQLRHVRRWTERWQARSGG